VFKRARHVIFQKLSSLYCRLYVGQVEKLYEAIRTQQRQLIVAFAIH